MGKQQQTRTQRVGYLAEGHDHRSIPGYSRSMPDTTPLDPWRPADSQDVSTGRKELFAGSRGNDAEMEIRVLNQHRDVKASSSSNVIPSQGPPRADRRDIEMEASSSSNPMPSRRSTRSDDTAGSQVDQETDRIPSALKGKGRDYGLADDANMHTPRADRRSTRDSWYQGLNPAVDNPRAFEDSADVTPRPTRRLQDNASSPTPNTEHPPTRSDRANEELRMLRGNNHDEDDDEQGYGDDEDDDEREHTGDEDEDQQILGSTTSAPTPPGSDSGRTRGLTDLPRSPVLDRRNIDRRNNPGWDHVDDPGLHHRHPDPQYVTFEQFQSQIESMQTTMTRGFESLAAALRSQTHVPQALDERRLQPVYEHPGEHPPHQGVRRHKLSGMPLRRSPDSNHLAEQVRVHLKRLMGPRLSVNVTVAEAQAYAAIWNVDRGQSCPPSTHPRHFRIDLAGYPRGPWNSSAVRVFLDDFISFHGLRNTPQLTKDVMHHAFTRIKTLKDQYLKSLQPATLQSTKEKRKRVLSRKGTLFQQRLYGATYHRLPRRDIEMLQRLGPEGMSSDESDYDELATNPAALTRAPRYTIRRPPWRDNGITPWLREFDALYFIYRRTSEDLRGAYPRIRADNPAQPHYSESKKFVSSLPINAYSNSWLQRRNDVFINVRPDEETFNFQHHPDVLAYIRGGTMAESHT